MEILAAKYPWAAKRDFSRRFRVPARLSAKLEVRRSQSQVKQDNPGSGLRFSLPARDHCGESDLPKRGGKGPTPLPTPFPAPVAHQRRKRGGRSLHQHPSRTARRYAGREGDTRGAASLRFFARDAGNPCCPASGAAFREYPKPQRRGLRPLRERRCASQDLRHVRPTPPRQKGVGPSDATSLTPRGGTCRSFQDR